MLKETNGPLLLVLFIRMTAVQNRSYPKNRCHGTSSRKYNQTHKGDVET